VVVAAGCGWPRFFLPIGDVVALESDLLYMLDQFKLAHGSVMGLPWSRRKRLIGEHVELEVIRGKAREEAVKAARRRR